MAFLHFWYLLLIKSYISDIQKVGRKSGQNRSFFFSEALFSAVRYGNHSRVVYFVRSELRLTLTKISGRFSGYFSRLPDHKFASWVKKTPQNHLLTGFSTEIQPKIMKNCSQGQGIDFYHANHFSNLFRIWWESFLKKQIFEKTIFEISYQTKICDFLHIFGINLIPKKSKNLQTIWW